MVGCLAGASVAAVPVPPAEPDRHPTTSQAAGASQHRPEMGAEVPSEHGAESHDAPHEGEPLWKTGARLLNFAVLVGVLVYFLRAPMSAFLAQRGVTIRRDLTSAAEMRQEAAAQLAEIERKVAALPGTLAALRAQAARDIAAERVRFRDASEAERRRLIELARRRVEMALRVAERELALHAADLIVERATARIRRLITPEDQARLIDEYLARVPAAGRPITQAPTAGGTVGELGQ
jgi:F-type H+-transporting ATPase subunit b